MPSHAEARRGWADEVERREAAEQRVAELEPAAARAHQLLEAEGAALIGTVAKRLGVTETFLRRFLRGEGLLCSYGAKRNEPMARYVASGHFEVKVRVIGEPPVQRTTTYVTGKGEALIWERLFCKGLVTGPRPTTHQLALEGL
ncbi:phage antirepressor KilAC domain-containing protein [Nonomuraea sp. NPDC003727]